MRPWDEIQPELRRAVAQDRATGRSMQEVADSIPVGRVTLYRLIAGVTRHPPRATRYACERYLFQLERSAADAHPN